MSFKARYFPVLPQPLKMSAGLHRFGTDFGQGARDRQFFHLDGDRPRYLEGKRHAVAERRVAAAAGADCERARDAALDWMRATLAHEAPEVLDACARDTEARDDFDALARALQEDFCVLAAGENFAGRAALIDVRFPSGWRPERLAGATFEQIHIPVPGFPGNPQAGRSMVRTMVERGPFVRFAWTLCPDDALDRHPDDRRRATWSQPEGVWLRVERQITVPLRAAGASVFLIRVYHYPLRELTPQQQIHTVTALTLMPDAIRHYKGLPTAAQLTALLAQAPWGEARRDAQPARTSSTSDAVTASKSR